MSKSRIKMCEVEISIYTIFYSLRPPQLSKMKLTVWVAWNCCKTVADRAKLYIERYWEVMGGLVISVTTNHITLSSYPLPRGSHHFPVETVFESNGT